MSNYKHLIVDFESNDMRIDRFVRTYYKNILQGNVEKLLRKKHIKVNKKAIKSSYRLQEGDSVQIPLFDNLQEERNYAISAGHQKYTHKQAEELRESIIYQDNNILAINKKAGIAVQGGSGVRLSIDDMLDELSLNYSDRPKLVHRLDKDTSGVLLLARKRSVAADVTLAFKRKDVQKVYWALVKGKPKRREGKIKLPLMKANIGGQDKVVVDHERGQEAISYYKVIESVGDITLVELMPVTGRTHQLRVHMQEIGCPIIGDGKYGGRDVFVGGISNKMHLHARQLILPKMLGEDAEIIAPLSPHMVSSFKALGIELNVQL